MSMADGIWSPKLRLQEFCFGAWLFAIGCPGDRFLGVDLGNSLGLFGAIRECPSGARQFLKRSQHQQPLEDPDFTRPLKALFMPRGWGGGGVRGGGVRGWGGGWGGVSL